jgi:Putative peptidoglycan-binding domain-containing protein
LHVRCGGGEKKEIISNSYLFLYPGYPSKLIKIIEENRLYEFDGDSSNREAAVDLQSQKIKKFQHLCNNLGIRDSEGKTLVEDNILGPRTRSCLNKLPVLKEGSRGFAVGFIQEVVGAAPVDGIFGPITKRKVMEYQSAKGILADGIVGIETWTKLVTT